MVYSLDHPTRDEVAIVESADERAASREVADDSAPAQEK